MDDKPIYDLLLKLNLPIRSICGGLGTCGKCKVLIQKGSEYLNQITNAEKKFLSNEDLESGYRLACQTKINDKYIDMLQELKPPQFRIFLPSELLFEDFNILTTGINKEVKLK